MNEQAEYTYDVFISYSHTDQAWVWTVNDVRLMRLLVWFGVDGLTTDHPEVWPEVVGTR